MIWRSLVLVLRSLGYAGNIDLTFFILSVNVTNVTSANQMTHLLACDYLMSTDRGIEGSLWWRAHVT